MQIANKVKIKSALKDVIIVAIIAIISIVGVFSSISSGPSVNVNGVLYKVDIADTLTLRQQGLSGRDSLARDKGMLFIFDEPGLYGFWMKDMNFSIDIIWISSEGEIAHIERRVSPNSYPEVFYPSIEVRYVLEVPAGEANRNGFKVGDKVSINL